MMKCSLSTQFVTNNVRKIFGLLVKCLRQDVGAGFKKYCLRGDDKEASEAYRQLLEHIERDLIVKNFQPSQWVWHGIMFSVIVAFLMVSVAVPNVHSLSLLHLKAHSWTLLLLVAASGWPLIQFVTLVVSEPFVWVFRTKRYTVLFARRLKDRVDVTLWFALVLMVWFTWYGPMAVKDKHGARLLHMPVEEYKSGLKMVVNEITRLLLALTIGAALWTVKRALYVKLLSDLHYIALCDRVRQTILDFTAIYYIEMRRCRRKHSGTDVALKSNNKPSTSTTTDSKVVDQDITVVVNQDITVVVNDKEGKERDDGDNEGDVDQEHDITVVVNDKEGKERDDGDNEGDVDHLSRLWEGVVKVKKETVPIWILKILMDTYLEDYNKTVARKTKIENDDHQRSTILQRLDETEDYEKLMHEANMMLEDVMGGRTEDHVDIDQKILEAYGLKEEKINQVLELLASKNNGEKVQRVTQDQFLRWAVKAVKNCKGLKHTIESSRRVFKKLQMLMNSFVIVLTVVIWLMLSDLVTNAQIAILFTPFLSVSFIFAESLKRALDGLVFVFGVHPYDVGDRVIIDKVEMKVVELHILKTVFTRCDSGIEAIYPNCELSSKAVINLEVQPEGFDSIEFTVPEDAPQELICDLQIKIKKTLDDNVTFTSENKVVKKQISDKNVTMIVYFKYLVTYISSETKAQHRSKVLSKIIRLRKQMKIDMRRVNEMNKKNKKSIGINEDGQDLKLAEEDEETADILRFKINAKVKLSKIEDRKKIIMRTIQDYDPSLKGCTIALLTGLNKEKITMDVRIRHSKGHLTTEQKNEIKRVIENIMSKIDDEQGRERQYEVSWLSEPDWDDDC